jgi:truncated hemoglobin YjbI
MSSIHETIGELPTLEVAIQLSERVAGDSELASFFVGMDLHKLRSYLVTCLDETVDGPAPHSVPTTRRVHARLQKEQRYLVAVAHHLSGTLQDFGIGGPVAAAVMERVVPLATQIVSTRTSAAS